MPHFLVVSQPFASHVAVLETLATELVGRGHRVSWAAPVDVLGQLRDDRIERLPIGRDRFPPGSLERIVDRAAHPKTPWGLRRVVQDMALATATFCDAGLPLLRERRIDVMLSDQMEAAGGLLGAAAGVPVVSVACALPINREPDVPLPVMPWPFATDEPMRVRHRVSERLYDRFMAPHADAIRAGARRLGLEPRSSMDDCLSPLLQLSQTSTSFDFPRRRSPAHFAPVGPLRAARTLEPALAYPLRADRPFVFASLGTLQGGRFALFRKIARACLALDAQLLIAHCGLLNEAQCGALRAAGATWVEAFAPQRAVLGKVDVLVTHAGLNTVLDALVAGKPMLALPIAFDQPGVAARIVHAGAGLRLTPAWAGATAIRRALQRLLEDASFRQRARSLGDDLIAAGGVRRAADLVEARVGVAATRAVVEEAA